jgi:hypothetical protein
VQFRPTAGGARAGTLRVTDNNNGVAGSFQDVPLSGTGLAAQPTAGVTPASLTFAATNVGATNPTPQTVTLSNTGNAVLNIASIAASGDFARVPGGTTATTGGTCATTVAANGGSCTIRVQFTPTVAGSRAGLLTITDNSGNVAGSTQTVTLAGTGTAVNGVASITPSPVAFGASQVGIARTIVTTLRNTGSGVLNVTGIATAGSTDFSRQAGGCAATPFNLAANATCTITVRFLPTAAAARTGTLTVTSNSGGVANTATPVQLTGTGVNSAITATPNPLAFGNNSVGPVTGGNGVSITLLVRNTGPAGSLLAVTSTAITPGANSAGQFTVTSTNCPTAATLASNATCNVVTRFRASGATNTAAARVRSATLRVNNNSSATPALNVPMTGTATPAGLLGL